MKANQYVKLYIWDLPQDTNDKDLEQIISSFVPRYELKNYYNGYFEIKVSQEYSQQLDTNLRPSFKITTDIHQIPLIYITNIPQIISNEEIESTIKHLCPIKKITFLREMSNDDGIDRHFFVEFNQIEECEDFVEKYQNYEFDGMSMMIKQLTDSDVLSNSRKYMVTITNLTSESTPSNNVREIRQFLTSKIGPIITLKPFQNGDLLNVNVVFLNPDDSKKAITTDDVFSPNVKRFYTRTTIRMYNLHPNITENEIINYFDVEFKPVSVTIYDMEQEHCWWARVTFNQSNIEDVFNANEFLKKSDRKPIGVLIPFGYIPYSGIDKDRFSAYKKLAMENINDNAIKIKETVGISMDDVLSFLIRNNLNDVTFLDRKIPYDKYSNQLLYEKEYIIIAFKTVKSKNDAFEMFMQKRINGKYVKVFYHSPLEYEIRMPMNRIKH